MAAMKLCCTNVAAMFFLLFIQTSPLMAGHFPLLGHPPGHPPFPPPDFPLPLRCFSRCVAKCLGQGQQQQQQSQLQQCQQKCRPYGQHDLCDSTEKRKKRSNSADSAEQQGPLGANHPAAKNFECWKRCKDLGLPPGGPKSILPAPREVQAEFNDNFTIDISWQPPGGPEGGKASLYLIQVEAQSPNHQISQIFTQNPVYYGLAPASAENICGPISVQIGAVNEANGVGHFSKPVQLEGKGPEIPARMELFSVKFNNTPFVTDDYDVNGTLDVELLFKFDGWPFGIEDLEVSPLFHLFGCAVPDLSQAMPEPEFHSGRRPNTVMTQLGADVMYRRCRFVYAVEEVRSNKCGRQYEIEAGQKDFQSIELNCETVEDSAMAPGDVCVQKTESKAPECGQFDQFAYKIIEETVDNATKEERLSVNITFAPFQRVLQMKPKYFVVLYGNAAKFGGINNNFERLLAGVNMTDVLGEMTNCAQFAADKSCKRFYSNNSIILDGLQRNTSYGVLLCAVLDPRNLTFPSVNGTDKSVRPRAFGLFLPPKGQHRHFGGANNQEGQEESDEAEDAEEVEKKRVEEYKAKRFVRFLIAGAVLLVALLVLLAVAFFCWIRRQKEQLRKKRLNFEAMRRDREQRYTDLPTRREDPWELERRNLIIYEDKKLGAGAFGSVYLGKFVGIHRSKEAGNGANHHLSIGLLRAENSFVAVKMLPEYADDLSKSEFLREIGLMKSLGYHERLVNMLACVTQSEPYCLIVEYCSDGDLLQFLRARCKYMLELDGAGVNYSDPDCELDFDQTMIMTVKQLLMFAVQISYGLEYLSQKGFVHRDVAARNILVHEKTHAKIGDFGLCRFIYADSANYKGRGGRLPIKWMSPEAIRHYEFTTSSDVWSFGVLMFEIITLGGTPYPGIQPDDMLSFLESGKRIAQPDNCPDEYYKVMCACWATDHRIRPDFAAIRQQLALQLENVSDEYAYLKLDAKKDYYNVSYGELKAQRGEEVERRLGQQQQQNEEEEEVQSPKVDDEEEEEMAVERRRRRPSGKENALVTVAE